MQIQTEILQKTVNKDFSPIGLDQPYWIIVGNNPVNFVDPWGLIWKTIGYRHPFGRNYGNAFKNKFSYSDIGGKTTPDHYKENMQRIVIQKWVCDPNHPERNKEHPMGSTREITQTNILYLRRPKEVGIYNNNEGYYYRMEPEVEDRTYKNYPN